MAFVILCIPVAAIAASKTAHEAHAHGPANAFPMAETPRAEVSKSAQDSSHDDHKDDDELAMSESQIEASQIEVGAASSEAAVGQTLAAPGVVTLDQDRVARVPAKVVGSVAQLRKKLGDIVEKDEIVAILDSREVADAKSEFLSASIAFDLQKTLFERTQTLWDKKIATEQVFLQSRATFVSAELRLGLARQKLVSLGFSPQSIAQMKPGGTPDLRQYPVRSPIAGRVIDRKVDVGAAVGANNDPSELYMIADLSSVWVDLAVPLADLDRVREGQAVVFSAPGGHQARGRIIFIGPMVNQETRAARVLAALPNPEMRWRPGVYVSARIETSTGTATVTVPRAAIQTVEGKPSVFVRTEKGFNRRPVTLGKTDGERIEVVAGLEHGEKIAASNTFILKSELGKSEASHDH